jgi:GNAT superfamily N-acetyltransferase
MGIYIVINESKRTEGPQMIEIQKLTEETAELLFTVEDRRLDSEGVVIRPKQGGFELSYRAMPGSAWRVGNAQRDIPMDIPAWLNGSEKCVFFAWFDEELAGQILLEAYENNLARIRDIRVSLAVRRRGIGAAMIALASDWAKKRELFGLYAQTQDANAGACQFLTKCGFQLGGVDMLRYAARSRETLQVAGLRESALFFYQFIRQGNR